jgi:hypothetical protein
MLEEKFLKKLIRKGIEASVKDKEKNVCVEIRKITLGTPEDGYCELDITNEYNITFSGKKALEFIDRFSKAMNTKENLFPVRKYILAVSLDFNGGASCEAYFTEIGIFPPDSLSKTDIDHNKLTYEQFYFGHNCIDPEYCGAYRDVCPVYQAYKAGKLSRKGLEDLMGEKIDAIRDW